MKSVLSPLVFFALLTSLVISSCTSDVGYSSYSSDDFLGSYLVQEACDSGEYEYYITITRGDFIDEVFIHNFAGYERTVVGEIFNNRIEVNNVVSGIEFTGTGRLTASGDLDMNYTVKDFNTYDSCSMFGYYQ